MKRALLSMALAMALASAVGVSVLAVAAQNSEPEPSGMAVDPVCNIVVRQNPELSADYAGKTYYFCMKADLVAFQKDPEKYVSGGSHRHPEPTH